MAGTVTQVEGGGRSAPPSDSRLRGAAHTQSQPLSVGEIQTQLNTEWSNIVTPSRHNLYLRLTKENVPALREASAAAAAATAASTSAAGGVDTASVSLLVPPTPPRAASSGSSASGVQPQGATGNPIPEPVERFLTDHAEALLRLDPSITIHREDGKLHFGLAFDDDKQPLLNQFLMFSLLLKTIMTNTPQGTGRDDASTQRLARQLNQPRLGSDLLGQLSEMMKRTLNEVQDALDTYFRNIHDVPTQAVLDHYGAKDIQELHDVLGYIVQEFQGIRDFAKQGRQLKVREETLCEPVETLLLHGVGVAMRLIDEKPSGLSIMGWRKKGGEAPHSAVNGASTGSSILSRLRLGRQDYTAGGSQPRPLEGPSLFRRYRPPTHFDLEMSGHVDAEEVGEEEDAEGLSRAVDPAVDGSPDGEGESKAGADGRTVTPADATAAAAAGLLSLPATSGADVSSPDTDEEGGGGGSATGKSGRTSSGAPTDESDSHLAEHQLTISSQAGDRPGDRSHYGFHRLRGLSGARDQRSFEAAKRRLQETNYKLVQAYLEGAYPVAQRPQGRLTEHEQLPYRIQGNLNTLLYQLEMKRLEDAEEPQDSGSPDRPHVRHVIGGAAASSGAPGTPGSMAGLSMSTPTGAARSSAPHASGTFTGASSASAPLFSAGPSQKRVFQRLESVSVTDAHQTDAGAYYNYAQFHQPGVSSSSMSRQPVANIIAHLEDLGAATPTDPLVRLTTFINNFDHREGDLTAEDATRLLRRLCETLNAVDKDLFLCGTPGDWKTFQLTRNFQILGQLRQALSDEAVSAANPHYVGLMSCVAPLIGHVVTLLDASNEKSHPLHTALVSFSHFTNPFSGGETVDVTRGAGNSVTQYRSGGVAQTLLNHILRPSDRLGDTPYIGVIDRVIERLLTHIGLPELPSTDSSAAARDEAREQAYEKARDILEDFVIPLLFKHVRSDQGSRIKKHTDGIRIDLQSQDLFDVIKEEQLNLRDFPEILTAHFEWLLVSFAEVLGESELPSTVISGNYPVFKKATYLEQQQLLVDHLQYLRRMTRVFCPPDGGEPTGYSPTEGREPDALAHLRHQVNADTTRTINLSTVVVADDPTHAHTKTLSGVLCDRFHLDQGSGDLSSTPSLRPTETLSYMVSHRCADMGSQGYADGNFNDPATLRGRLRAEYFEQGNTDNTGTQVTALPGPLVEKITGFTEAVDQLAVFRQYVGGFTWPTRPDGYVFPVQNNNPQNLADHRGHVFTTTRFGGVPSVQFRGAGHGMAGHGGDLLPGERFSFVQQHSSDFNLYLGELDATTITGNNTAYIRYPLYNDYRNPQDGITFPVKGLVFHPDYLRKLVQETGITRNGGESLQDYKNRLFVALAEGMDAAKARFSDTEDFADLPEDIRAFSEFQFDVLKFRLEFEATDIEAMSREEFEVLDRKCDGIFRQFKRLKNQLDRSIYGKLLPINQLGISSLFLKLRTLYELTRWTPLEASPIHLGRALSYLNCVTFPFAQVNEQGHRDGRLDHHDREMIRSFNEALRECQLPDLVIMRDYLIRLSKPENMAGFDKAEVNCFIAYLNQKIRQCMGDDSGQMDLKARLITYFGLRDVEVPVEADPAEAKSAGAGEGKAGDDEEAEVATQLVTVPIYPRLFAGHQGGQRVSHLIQKYILGSCLHMEHFSRLLGHDHVVDYLILELVAGPALAVSEDLPLEARPDLRNEVVQQLMPLFSAMAKLTEGAGAGRGVLTMGGLNEEIETRIKDFQSAVIDGVLLARWVHTEDFQGPHGKIALFFVFENGELKINPKFERGESFKEFRKAICKEMPLFQFYLALAVEFGSDSPEYPVLMAAANRVVQDYLIKKSGELERFTTAPSTPRDATASIGFIFHNRPFNVPQAVLPQPQLALCRTAIERMNDVHRLISTRSQDGSHGPFVIREYFEGFPDPGEAPISLPVALMNLFRGEHGVKFDRTKNPPIDGRPSEAYLYKELRAMRELFWTLAFIVRGLGFASHEGGALQPFTQLGNPNLVPDDTFEARLSAFYRDQGVEDAADPKFVLFTSFMTLMKTMFYDPLEALRTAKQAEINAASRNQTTDAEIQLLSEKRQEGRALDEAKDAFLGFMSQVLIQIPKDLSGAVGGVDRTVERILKLDDIASITPEEAPPAVGAAGGAADADG